MNEITTFDTIVVYSARLATSANSKLANIISPFNKGSSKKNYDLAYSYFLGNCEKNNISAAFTTSADIIGPGKCRSYWLFKNRTWIKVRNPAFSTLIFDKFFPSKEKTKRRRKMLFSSKQVKSFNDLYLFDLFFDKQKTHNKLPKVSIPTVSINDNTMKEVEKAYSLLDQKISNHKNKADFSDEIVMKDRFGSGGINVYKFATNHTSKISALAKKRKGISFIIQPFVKFDKGFTIQESTISTDIRLIYLGNKLIQTYTRTAKPGDFRCNEHAGGLLKYISKDELPTKLVEVSNDIANTLDKEFSIFALDFIISNNGNIYLLEANTGPGLDWNLSIKENEIKTKKLIRIIINEIGRRINVSKNDSEKKVEIQSTDFPLFATSS